LGHIPYHRLGVGNLDRGMSKIGESPQVSLDQLWLGIDALAAALLTTGFIFQWSNASPIYL